MPETKITNLGRAITRLGLEDRFLSNGELQNYPLAERVALANDIISEKLALGRWSTVVNMIWGGFGKADVLYDGDRSLLKREILQSALKSNPNSDEAMAMDPALETLAKAGEYDFLLELATQNPQNSYEDITKITNRIPNSYFQGSEEGRMKNKKLCQLKGKKALREKRYREAFVNLFGVGDEKSVEKIFETVISSQGKIEDVSSDYPIELLRDIALSSRDKKDERLKRILLEVASDRIYVRAETAMNIFREHRVPLDEKERQTFYEFMAAKLSKWDIERKFGEDSELSLLWARKHSDSEPKAAYQIFRKQKYDGEEIKTAVLNGLKLDEKRDDGMTVSEVSPEHLRMVYDQVPFEVQISISERLKDRNELSRLSNVAKEKGDLRTAYNLWVRAGNGFDSAYMDNIRGQMIRKSIEESLESTISSPHLFFIHPNDSRGHTQAFDALMETSLNAKRKGGLLSVAHELALRHDSDGRLEKVRREMVAVNPRWALYQFSSGRDEQRDSVGYDYALTAIAKEEGVEKEQLRTVIGKYGISRE